MASGSRKKRGQDEYIFIDGQAMRADEAVKIQLEDTEVPGQKEAQKKQESRKPKANETSEDASLTRDAKKQDSALKKLASDDAFAPSATSTILAASLIADDRRKLRQRYLIFGILLICAFLVSLCVDTVNRGFYAPLTVLQSYAAGLELFFMKLFGLSDYAQRQAGILEALPDYAVICSHAWLVVRYLICGLLLAVSGMLYQNAFRNPIAAPSMLGVSNGVTLAILLLVLIFGTETATHLGLYYVFSYISGAAILALVMLGGKWVSGKRRFNTVNMILIGTVVSQLVGVVITYAQSTLSDQEWETFYSLQSGLQVSNAYSYASLFIGGIVALIPVILFRFRLNLISFCDEETHVLGVDPNRLRLIALTSGSLMILTAQINAGQVAMISLIIPFIVRSVFGAEFRKQLGGNLLVGALVLIICEDVASMSYFAGLSLDLGTVVTVLCLPLFVWMLAVRQRSWE